MSFSDIEIKNVSFTYLNGNSIFKDLTLDLCGSEFTVLVGDNGCGKTTLTKLISGIYRPESGHIRVFGRDTALMTMSQMGEVIGYVFQQPERQLFAMSVWDELTFVPGLKDEDMELTNRRAEGLLNILGLGGHRNRYPLLLSQGEKKRLAIATALMQNPRYVVLDEPTASLDESNVDILSGMLKKLMDKGIGILAVTHDMKFALKHGSRIIRLDGGKIAVDDKI